jgi:hypothetical protein
MSEAKLTQREQRVLDQHFMLNKAHLLLQFVAVAGFGFVILLAVGSLWWPLPSDQSTFAWEGMVVLKGGLPYKDAWDLKGPLAPYPYALAMRLLGPGALSIRIMDLFFMGASCWVLRALVLRINGGERFGANAAILFYALIYYGWWDDCPAQPDGWGGTLIMVAMYLLLRNAGRWHLFSMLMIGVLIATAALLKPTFLIYAAIPLLYPRSDSYHDRYLLAPRAVFLLTFLSIIAISTLALEVSGALPDYLDVLSFTFSSHISRGHLYSLMSWDFLVSRHLLLPFMLVPVGLAAIPLKGGYRVLFIIVTWFALSVLAVVLQGWGFDYQWLPTAMVLAVVFGCCLSHLRLNRQVGLNNASGTAIFLLMWLSVIGPLMPDPFVRNYEWMEYISGSLNREQFTDSLTKLPYGVLERLSSFVASHTTPKDLVLVWGQDLQVNVLSGRIPPTRFGYSYPLIVTGPLREKYRRIFIQEVSEHVPRYIIVDGVAKWTKTARYGYTLQFPEFEVFVNRSYEMAATLGGFEIFALKVRTER